MTVARPDAQMMQTAGKMWWLWLVTGILWILISFVILQFDVTSAATVGFIVGIMFLIAGIQYIVVGTQVDGWKWLWFVFGQDVVNFISGSLSDISILVILRFHSRVSQFRNPNITQM